MAATCPTTSLSDPLTEICVGTGTVDIDPLRRRVPDRMRVAEGQDEIPALPGGAEADADQVEVAGEAGADALHHVRDQASG